MPPITSIQIANSRSGSERSGGGGVVHTIRMMVEASKVGDDEEQDAHKEAKEMLRGNGRDMFCGPNLSRDLADILRLQSR